MARTAFITGIYGQDGAYLAQLLLSKGYRVVGASRSTNREPNNLQRLGIDKHIEIVTLDLLDNAAVQRALADAAPDEIYHLAGQSSVAKSFEQPKETFDSIVQTSLNLLEYVREKAKHMRLFIAGSGECFGDTGGVTATESTGFSPQSPYATGKVASANLVRNYRDAYGIYSCTGFLYNHESPLRPLHFVTQKIVQVALAIAAGRESKLELGNVNIVRDWGYAPDFVDAMWRMLQADAPQDFVIATGTSHSLTEFAELVFSQLGLNWRDHIISSPSLLRPTDIAVIRANPAKIEQVLGWKATHDLRDTIAQMLQGKKL